MTMLAIRQPNLFFMPGQGLLVNSAANRHEPGGVSQKPVNNVFENVLANAGVRVFSIDLRSKVIVICETLRNSLGLPRLVEPSASNLLSAVRLIHRGQVIEMIRSACNGEDPEEIELQLSENCAEAHSWFKLKATLYGKSGGDRPAYLSGTLIDITGQKQEQFRKDDCMAMLSHELRSPLTTVKLYVQMVMKQSRSTKNKGVADLLANADIQTGAMSRLIDDFLSLSQSEQVGMKLRNGNIDLIPLIREVTSEMKLKFPGRIFEFEFESLVAVCGDRDKLTQVLLNYLSNAIKYSPEGSRITIRCESSGGKTTVSVKDRGNGIPTADQTKLFTRYYRADKSGVKGFGIGLYLVKKIIQAHGGEVWVRSIDGQGSVFGFTLP